MHNIVIGTSPALSLIFWKQQKEDMEKRVNGYKYQWNKLSKHNTNWYVEHLQHCFVIPST